MFVTMMASVLYILFSGLSFFGEGYTTVDRVFACLLMAAEGFIFVHTVGYFVSVLKARRYTEAAARVFTPAIEPPVAVIVASFNEPPDVLEATLVAVTGMDYKNKTVYVLDDSTNPELRAKAKEVAAQYGAECIQRANRRGAKAGAINDFIPTLDATYVVIFDADQKPVYNFLRDTIPILEENPRLAFIQTPQFYENTDVSRVALGAAQQQAVFYEYICEGKSTSGAMFCCGTNVIFRREALLSIGGLDENSITEDFATSINLHMQKWESLYYNNVYVYGMGPETLFAHFIQQRRWAMGTLGVFKRVLKLFFTHITAFRPGQWWEYMLSGSYYFIGIANLILMICPIIFLLFNVKPLIVKAHLYAVAFIPYLVFSLWLFYSSMRQRGYHLRGLWAGQALGFISFYVYVMAAISALSGRKIPFGVTPKGKGGKLPLQALWPQLGMLALSLLAAGWGVGRMVVSQNLVQELAGFTNIFWALYHCYLLSYVFTFNQDFEGYPDERVFRDFQAERDGM
jgi:cellulose synthase (UDP-forming)